MRDNILEADSIKSRYCKVTRFNNIIGQNKLRRISMKEITRKDASRIVSSRLFMNGKEYTILPDGSLQEVKNETESPTPC